MYSYGLIGNCQVSALVNKSGSIDWLCLPRPDSPPVFGKILDKNGGHFSINPISEHYSTQEYIVNTNILVTTFYCKDGSEFTITDFCPRFELHGRNFRPNSLFRIVEAIKGKSTICVQIEPVDGWGKNKAQCSRGNSHVQFDIRGDALRVTSNMSMTFLTDKCPFILDEKIYFSLTWNTPLEENLIDVSRNFLEKTTHYWKKWVKHCSIPTLYQQETIRSALILKLHCYEDTGAILAALTTSLPEEYKSERNWDYRFCWLRDAAFVIAAFKKLGHFEEMEGFLRYLLNIAEKIDVTKEHLRPVYCLDLTLPLPENQHLQWEGFGNSSPVRSNNQAAEHFQIDVYGEMILTLCPIFFDDRFKHLRTRELEKLIYDFAKNCVLNISVPDAGLWEIREGWCEHSFSNLMCWAGIDRTINMHKKGFLQNIDINFLMEGKIKAQNSIRKATVAGSLRNSPDDPSFDASLLFLPMLRYEDQELCQKSVMAIYENLQVKDGAEIFGFLYRYLRKDDFGTPQSSFLICSFWLVIALEKINEPVLAKKILEEVLTAANHVGLFSEHFVPKTKTQLGNFPQAYSHVGLINATFAVSPSWDDFV